MAGRMWNCPFCKAEISSDTHVCPSCLHSLDWNAPAQSQAAQLMPPNPSPLGNSSDGRSLKTCPFCAEEIQVAAIKCKHCGSMLTQALVVNVNSPFAADVVRPDGITVMPPDAVGALRKTCPSCKEAVRMDATVCPNCRNPLFKTAGAQAVYALIMLGLLCVFLFYFAQSCEYANEASKMLDKLK